MFLELRECKARSNSVSEGSKYLLTPTSYFIDMKGLIKMRKLMLVLMCATTMTSMAACGAKEPVTPEVTKAVTETKTAEEQETVSETVGMPNPWTDCKNLNEAEDNVGFSITVPEKIDGYTRTMIQTLDKEVIQVFYEKDDQSDSTILIRKGIGSDDISGDYNTYNEKTQLDINKHQIMEQGNDGKVMLATWTDAGYTYSVSTPGLSESEMENIIQQIE